MSTRRPGTQRLPTGTPIAARVRLWWHQWRQGVRLSPAKALGFIGEDAAARRLRREGYRVLARNVVTFAGEADLVARAPDGRTRVIVEVKARRVPASVAASPGGGAFPPERAVDADKRRRLASIARELARLNGWGDAPVRIDVIAVEWIEGQPRAEPVIRHWIDAVR